MSKKYKIIYGVDENYDGIIDVDKKFIENSIANPDGTHIKLHYKAQEDDTIYVLLRECRICPQTFFKSKDNYDIYLNDVVVYKGREANVFYHRGKYVIQFIDNPFIRIELTKKIAKDCEMTKYNTPFPFSNFYEKVV